MDCLDIARCRVGQSVQLVVCITKGIGRTVRNKKPGTMARLKNKIVLSISPQLAFNIDESVVYLSSIYSSRLRTDGG
ncbi:hypothetical protein FHT21_002312 [Pedobacter sp. SG908]|nr:hypothetical protein [Pedobacter sp. SG908]NMN37137.1 hypothetical protein [Pedobacter sp. SG918]